MTADLLTIRDLWVTLGDKPILKGVNAHLARGRVSALIGLNGAGKSTLLRALVKEVPYSGEVRFHCGHDHSVPTPQHVGYVPQKLRVEANLPLTVYDLFALSLSGRPLFLGAHGWVRRVMEKQLADVGATHLKNAPVEKLSGGELQRVLLAVALEPSPELLLLDEPAAGIDFSDEQKFYDVIGDLNRRTGVTILLVSHDLSVVPRLAHEVLCLKDGRIACHGPPHEICTADALAQVFGGDMALYAHPHAH